MILLKRATPLLQVFCALVLAALVWVMTLGLVGQTVLDNDNLPLFHGIVGFIFMLVLPGICAGFVIGFLCGRYFWSTALLGLGVLLYFFIPPYHVFAVSYHALLWIFEMLFLMAAPLIFGSIVGDWLRFRRQIR
jgi:hypothetical protein